MLLATVPLAWPAVPTVEVPVEAWRQHHHFVGPGAHDEASQVVVEADGDIIVAGTSGADMLTVKYSGRDGTMLWHNRYERVSVAAVDSSGNVVVTGYSYGTNAHGYFYTAKFAGVNGSLLWEQRHPRGYGRGIVVDPDRNVIVFGSADNGTNSDFYTAKYAAEDGSLVWERCYDGPANSYYGHDAIAVDRSGNVVVTGRLGSGLNYINYTAKYAAADGALLWEKQNPSAITRAIAMDASGNVVLTGVSEGDTGPDYYTAKYAAANGALLWERRYNGPRNDSDYGSAIGVDADGNVVVTGSSFGTNANSDFYTAKYAATNGALIWEQRYNGAANLGDEVKSLAIDISGNVVVAGSTDMNWWNTWLSDSAYQVLRYAAADGALLWSQRYDGPANKDDGARAVAVDTGGNVVVTGGSAGVPTGPDFTEVNYDIYTAKYAAADGAIVWEQRYDGVEEKQGVSKAVALDTSGNVVVTGTSGGEFYTAKYEATSSELLWEKRGPPGGAQAVAVDRNGNVIITGFSSDYYTAKYAGVDGTLLWERGDAHTLPYVLFDHTKESSVAVDREGNVVIAGTTGLGSNERAYSAYVARYAAANGALLWEHSFRGTVTAMKVDAYGNVVIAGMLFGLGPFDLGIPYWYTAKYAATDGVVWARQFRTFFEAPTALAVDSGNNVIVAGVRGGSVYIAKHAFSDGGLLWEQHTSGGQSYFAQTVVVDGNDDVFLTGHSYDGVVSTAKNAGSNGALLWKQHYRHLGFAYTYAQTMAVDGRGNVVVSGMATDNGVSGEDFVIKHSPTGGTPIWERSYGAASGSGSAILSPQRNLAIDPDGSFAVIASGDFATVKYVMTQVTYPTPIGISLAVSPDGACLRFTGDAGRTYRLQRTSNPAGPWTTFTTLTAPPDGVVEHLDLAPLVSPAFYRVAAP